MNRIGVGLLCLGGVLVACSNPVEVPESGLHPAIIEFSGNWSIEVPPTAKVGVTSEITVLTWLAPEFARRLGDTRLTWSENVLRIEPFDDFTQGISIEDAYIQYAHEVEVVFPQAGRYRVDVIGRSMPGYAPFAKTFWVDVK